LIVVASILAVLFALGYRSGPSLRMSSSAGLVYRVSKQLDYTVGGAQPRAFHASTGTVLIAVTAISPQSVDRVSDMTALCGQTPDHQVLVRAGNGDAGTCSNMSWSDVWPPFLDLQSVTMIFLVPDTGPYALVQPDGTSYFPTY
jgi:hypothetical protein